MLLVPLSLFPLSPYQNRHWNQSLQYSDQGASQFFDYRKYIAGPKGGGGYTQDVRPQALANFYDDAVEDAGSIFKNTGFNIHTYFDPDIQGQGSGYSIEVNKSYNLDPLAYYDPKRMGHANSLKAFTALSSMVDGTKMADSYFYSGFRSISTVKPSSLYANTPVSAASAIL